MDKKHRNEHKTAWKPFKYLVQTQIYLLELKNSQFELQPSQEAAEALGSISTNACIELLREFSEDADSIAADECTVILKMLGYSTLC